MYVKCCSYGSVAAVNTILDSIISIPGLVSVDDEESLGPKVVIPRTDDETFSEFFRSVTTENVKNDHLEILDEDLDTIINSSSQL